jgi:signal-transduction protein with cAMP-binding, CBS, and nucleotidyltransferase domain
MQVKDIMTLNRDWCSPQTVETKTARIMKEKKIGLVPVVDSEAGHKVIGVVTDQDLCLAVVAAGQHPDSVLVGTPRHQEHRDVPARGRSQKSCRLHAGESDSSGADRRC